MIKVQSISKTFGEKVVLTDVSGNFYVVCPGDTLASIARYYGVSCVYLQSRNGIPNANLIYAGHIIDP